MRGVTVLVGLLALSACVFSAHALRAVSTIDKSTLPQFHETHEEIVARLEWEAEYKENQRAKRGQVGGNAVEDGVPDASTTFEMCTYDQSVEVGETEIDAPIRSMRWAKKDRNIVYTLSSNGTLYKSRDEGRTWSNEMHHMAHSEEILPQTSIYRMHGVRDMAMTADDSKVWFLSNGNYYWTCEGEQEEYKTYAIEDVMPDVKAGDFRIERVSPHPVLPHVALMSLVSWQCYLGDREACHTRLFITKDFGKEWTEIATYVYQYAWGGDEETIFYNSIPDGKGAQSAYQPYDVVLSISTDSGKSVAKQYPRVPAFVYDTGVLYVGVFQDNTIDHFSLWVSRDQGRHLTRCIFGEEELSEKAFVILTNEEGASFINVQEEDDRWGTLFTSDSVDGVYVQSLRRNKRNQRVADFERVQGIEGVYLANYYDLPLEADVPDGEEVEPEGVEHMIKTVLTVDQGAEYFALPVPDNVPCSEEHCSLHLFGATQTTYSRVYSRANAVGLVLGTGNVGEFQQTREDAIGTYLSRDAGVTWELIRFGEYAYEIGDHGALLVMVSIEEAVQSIIYSWNEGLRWMECGFSELYLDATNVVVEPSATSQKFIVYGTRATVEGGIRGVMIHVDFSGLHERQCVGADKPGTEGSDYELWVPSFAGECILGERIAYVRRNRTSLCYNGLEYESRHTLSRCPCTIDDYICDEQCFEERIDISGTKQCVNVCADTDNDPTVRPEECDDTWVSHTGYRLVAEDQCDPDAGLNLLPVTVPCKETKEHSSSSGSVAVIVLVVVALLGLFVLVAVVGVGAYLFMTNEEFRERVEPFLERFQLPGGGGGGPSYSMVSEDQGSLLDDYDDDGGSGIGIVDDEPSAEPVEAFGASIAARQRLSGLPEVADEGDAPSIDGPSDSLVDM